MTDHQLQYRHGMQIACLASLNAFGRQGRFHPPEYKWPGQGTNGQPKLVRRPVSDEDRSLRAMEGAAPASAGPAS
jgi:hypothetical protein